MIAAVVTVAFISSSVIAGASNVKAVYIKSNDIFVSENGGPAQQITHDGLPKRMPLWSRDGSRIAFVEGGTRSAGLGDVEAIDSDGTKVEAIQVPAQPGGMRFIEGLQWVGNNAVAVTGTINPSTVESIVYDLSTGRKVNDVYDDLGGAAFSPDGKHVAYLTGSPHFSPDEWRRPTLNVDTTAVFPQHGAHTVFLTRPVWSSDDRSVAIIFQHYGAHKKWLFVWRVKGKSLFYPLAEAAATQGVDQQADLYWSKTSFIVRVGDRAWQWVEKSGDLRPFTPVSTNDPLQTERAEHERLETWVSKLGGRDADFWCASCFLTLLPTARGVGSSLWY